jgi:flavin reductase (DIM6/NTAB) family NADH-FMN oxidoreductase RutF
MFYDARKGHGLIHDPFYALVVPRPIGWITSISVDGVVNLAPFSFYNGCGTAPPQVMFHNSSGMTDGRMKDSLTNVEQTGEFVVNLVTWELREQMNETARHVASSVDEMAMAGLETESSILVKPPRVKASPVHLECRYFRTVEMLSDRAEFLNFIVFGEVVGVHISDAIMTDGMVDASKFRPIARMGYMDYSVVDNSFTMPKPD